MEALNKRLLSLDVMRGAIMVLLMLESTGLYGYLIEATNENFLHSFFIQFEHHPWHGLRFWDLIQPGFMFIAGTAMAFSVHGQQQKGITWNQSFIKTTKRSAWLFFWGVLDYAVRPQGLSFELWDVLTQLSFTMLVAFLIYHWSYRAQFFFSIGLLILTELLYRFAHVPNFDQPFTDQHNFGNYIDLVLMNKINSGGWVAINCLPTAAHTIWGAMAGKLLLSGNSGFKKIKYLLIAGTIGLLSGYLLDISFTPIIKRIATSSFVFASAGWCLLTLVFVYWLIDMKGNKKFTHFFVVVSMNSLFIYLFIEIVAGRWFNGYIGALTRGLMAFVSLPPLAMNLITSLVIFFIEWKMCEFLFRKKVFFKI
ncbi:MAG: DUF5009 domain-containing protein [Bacteroidetes bacterium]|nr:DUF5009 domain-containing protein [Bacteroidota bacterium]